MSTDSASAHGAMAQRVREKGRFTSRPRLRRPSRSRGVISPGRKNLRPSGLGVLAVWRRPTQFLERGPLGLLARDLADRTIVPRIRLGYETPASGGVREICKDRAVLAFSGSRE